MMTDRAEGRSARSGFALGVLAAAGCGAGATPAPPPGPASEPPPRPASGPDDAFLDDAIERAFIERGRLHLVDREGHQRVVPVPPSASAAKVADDHETVGYAEDEDTIVVLRGAVARPLDVSPIIRDWTFGDDGRTVIVYAGGRHFAGFYDRVEIASGEVLDHWNEGEAGQPRPAWVLPLQPAD